MPTVRAGSGARTWAAAEWVEGPHQVADELADAAQGQRIRKGAPVYRCNNLTIPPTYPAKKGLSASVQGR